MNTSQISECIVKSPFFISVVTSAIIAIMLFLLRDYFVIDVSNAFKGAISIAIPIVIGLRFKRYCDLKDKISEFELPASSPAKIKSQFVNLKKTFGSGKGEFFCDAKYVLQFFIFIAMSFVSISFDVPESVKLFLSYFSLLCFIVFCAIAFIYVNGKCKVTEERLSVLHKIEIAEKERAKMIEKLEGIRSKKREGNKGVRSVKKATLHSLLAGKNDD